MDSYQQTSTSAATTDGQFAKRASLLILVFVIAQLLNLSLHYVINPLVSVFGWGGKEIVLTNSVISIIFSFSFLLLPFAVPQKVMRIVVLILCAAYIISVITTSILSFASIAAF